MVDLYEKVIAAKKVEREYDESITMELLYAKANRTIEDMITYIGANPETLFPFAIELRKLDV